MPMKTRFPILKPMSRYRNTRRVVKGTLGMTTTFKNFRIGFQTINHSG